MLMADWHDRFPFAMRVSVISVCIDGLIYGVELASP